MAPLASNPTSRAVEKEETTRGTSGPAPRILFGLHTVKPAGAERIAFRLIDSFKDSFRVALVSLFDRELHREFLPVGPCPGGLRELLFEPADLLHTHLFLPGLVARIRRLWDRKIRWVHTVHYHDYRTIRWGRLKRWIDRHFVFPEPDVLVAVSPLVMESLAPFPRARLILNGLDTPPGPEHADGAPPKPPEPYSEAEVPTLGTVAMLRPEKGVHDLLEAVALLRDRGVEVRLAVAGDGPLRPTLEETARRLGIEAAVRFHGFLEDLAPFYRSTDLYVQPSREESFGMAALEAMARHLPIAVSDGGFLPALVGHGDWGAVALLREGESRAEALARTLEDALRRLKDLREKSRRGWKSWGPRVRPDAMVRHHRKAVDDALLPRVTLIQPIVTHATGGMQRQLRIQSRELDRMGHRVAVVQRRDPRLEREEELRKAWAHVELLQVPDRPGLPERLRGLLFTVAASLRLLVQGRGTEVYHAHQLYSPTLVGAMAKALRGGALVTKVTAAGSLGEARQLGDLPFLRLRRFGFRLIDRIIVLHGAMGREVMELGFTPDRIVVIPNSVEIPPAAAKVVPPDGGPVSILWVGRLSTEKGLDLLLRAARLLADDGLPLRIELVGGPDPDRNAEPELRRMVADLSLDSLVRFHAVRDDLSELYRKGPVFVLPSRSEGMSNALLEAMSWGLPCVVSDIAANRALVEDGVTGILFRDGDAGSLAQAVERLHKDLCSGRGEMARSLGQGARARVEEAFSVEGVARQLSDLYRELAG